MASTTKNALWDIKGKEGNCYLTATLKIYQMKVSSRHEVKLTLDWEDVPYLGAVLLWNGFCKCSIFNFSDAAMESQKIH